MEPIVLRKDQVNTLDLTKHMIIIPELLGIIYIVIHLHLNQKNINHQVHATGHSQDWNEGVLLGKRKHSKDSGQ